MARKSRGKGQVPGAGRKPFFIPGTEPSPLANSRARPRDRPLSEKSIPELERQIGEQEYRIVQKGRILKGEGLSDSKIEVHPDVVALTKRLDKIREALAQKIKHTD